MHLNKENNLINRLPKVVGSYRENADLSKTTWFNVGGNADILFRPHDVNDLAFFLKNKPLDIPVTILGVGSNLLVRDGGIRGVVIKLGRNFAQVKNYDNIIEAGGACLCYNIAMYAKENSISDLEFLVGIPGSIGGATFMNAGCYGSDISSILIDAQIVDEAGNINTVTPKDIGYIYRGNTLPHGIIFTKARFKGTHKDQNIIAQRIEEITKQRNDSQPIKSKTGGSTFKNPTNLRAWQLIDEAGCRGLTIGGAQISHLHCNFLINNGNATAKDIEMLGEEVRKRVKEKTGIELEWEIKIIGDPL